MQRSRLVVAALAPIVLLTMACSGSEDIAKSGPGTGSTHRMTTPPPSGRGSPSRSVTSSTPAASSSPTDGHGARLAGDGFSVGIPAGWADITSAVEAQNPRVDVAMGQVTAVGFRDNFNVVQSTPSTVLLDSSNTHLRHVLASELKMVTHTAVTTIPDRRIAGELAVGQTSRFQASGQSVTFVQYYTLHNGQAYPITMTFATSRQTQERALLGHILDSWRWVG
jgi:hypothetical protein